MRDSTDEVYNGLVIPKMFGSFIHDRLVVANLALHNFANIDDNSQETLEYIKQENAMEFEIAMSHDGKSFIELSAKQNSIARSLWMTKTKACIAHTFIDNEV